jgi:MFS family permease
MYDKKDHRDVIAATPTERDRGPTKRLSSFRKLLPLGLSSTFSSLSAPDFRMLWFGMLFSIAAMQMNVVARSWLAYDISGSGLALGIVAMARGLPQIVLSPLGGVAADRFDKRKLLIASQSSLCALSLINAVLVNLGIIEVWHLVIIGLFQGVVFPFTMPTRQAYIPELVGGDQVPNALAVNSSGRNFNRILAPSLSGILIAWHPTVVFYAIALLYFGATITLLRLPAPRLTVHGKEGVLRELMVGFTYIFGHRKLLALIVMGFIAVVLGMPFQLLLPVFQADVLHVGPALLGLMYTAVGIGALLGSLAVAYRSDDPRRGLYQVIAGTVFGAMLIPFAFSGNYLVSVTLLVIVGFASQAHLTFNRMLVFLNTDRKLYGRVMGVYMMNWALMPVATLFMGALVDTVGAPLTVAGAGAVLAASIITVALMLPTIWQRDEKGTPLSRHQA